MDHRARVVERIHIAAAEQRRCDTAVVVSKVCGVGAFTHTGGTGQQAGARGAVILQPAADGCIHPFTSDKSIAEQIFLTTGTVINGQAFFQLRDLSAELPVFLAFQHGVQLRHFGIKPRSKHILPGRHFFFPASHIQPLFMADRCRGIYILQQDADNISTLDTHRDS